MKELFQYVNPQGLLPCVVGTKKGTLLLIGTARCVWDDLHAFEAGSNDYDRMAVNDMMIYYPSRLDHGVSLHTDYLPHYTYPQFAKAARYGWPPIQTHSHLSGSHVGHVWPLRRDGGTSGLFGVFIALLMGYEQIVLAGSPVDNSPSFYAPPWSDQAQYGLQTVHEEWLRARDAVFKKRVKSLSGNTREWLGPPD